MLLAVLLLLFCPALSAACSSDMDCSLNGVCTAGNCTCDAPWKGERCHTLDILPGDVGINGIPLATYHGDSVYSTSWGGSVLQDPADGKFYMWAASMAHNCTMGEWQTNSEVVLASATFPMGPYEKVKTVVLPWAHNPQAIRAPDNTTTSGHVYALYTLGDGYDYRGQPKVCNSSESRAPPPPRPPGPPMPWPPTTQSCPQTPPYNWPDGHWDKCMLNGAINFTIFFSETPGGDYQRHTAQIIDWPAHSRGRPWEYGAYGNWNPSPVVHPNGTVYLLAHTEQFGFKHGEAILAADTWRGPYRLVASDSDNRWGGSTANAEDPFLWIDKRGNWHQLVEGNPMPGGHAFSTDGITWSDMAGCNGAYALEGCFNLTRQYVASNGSLANVSYYTERPKLLLTADGTPTHLFGTVYYHMPDKRTGGFTIVEPLRGSSTSRRSDRPFISERLQESSHARTYTSVEAQV